MRFLSLTSMSLFAIQCFMLTGSLWAVDQPKMQKILDSLKYGAPDMRVKAIQKAERLNYVDALGVWIKAIDDEDPRVRLAVVRALRGRKPDTAIKIFEKAAFDSDDDVRSEAVEILASQKSISSTSLLIRVFSLSCG